MNPLARELNQTLEGSAAARLFSDFGKRFYFPQGIAAQSAEAKQQAYRFNATIGMAFHKNQPVILPPIKSALPDLDSGDAVAYAPPSGDPELRNMWKELISEKNVPIEKNRISMPMVVSGLTNGIMNVADLFADPGDSVVCPDMFWGNYRLIFEARKQAIIETFPFFTKNGGLNIEGCRETIEEKAKNGKVILLLNFPNNPTGYSPTTREAQQLSKAIHACAEEGITVLAVIDDAYFGLFYDENTYKNSLFADLHDLHENVLAVKVDGATKEDYVWGFRIGFVTFGCRGMSEDQYSALETKLKGALRSSVSNSSRPAQSILKQAIKNETYRREKQNIFNMLQARYHKVREILEKRTTGKALKPLPFNSGYFMSFRFEGGSAEALRKELLLKEGIGTISIQDTYLRVAYSSVDLEHIEELFETIFATADQLSS